MFTHDARIGSKVDYSADLGATYCSVTSSAEHNLVGSRQGQLKWLHLNELHTKHVLPPHVADVLRHFHRHGGQ